MLILKKIWRPVAALALLFVLIKKGPFQIEQIQFILSQQKVLFAGITLFFIQFILLSIRWSFFVHLLVPLKLKQAFKLTLIGQFFSFFIPGGVGGDVVKALELSRTQRINKSEALSTVLADRILGLFAMTMMAALFLMIEVYQQGDAKLHRFLVVSSVLLLGVTAGLYLAPTILKQLEFLFKDKKSFILIKLDKVISSFQLTFMAFRNRKLQTKNIAICIVIQLISIYFLYYIVQTLGLTPPPFLVFFSLCCFGFLASAIPITPAGIGVGQAAFYFLFSQFSHELGQATVTAVSVLQLFYLLFALVGGILFSIQPKKIKQAELQAESI
ncbi:MAG: flippase-like domain-containing protein [Bdellovibrionaceae bacterium]|nr:flippase-like domain-containing protein [Bdellovibrio sp.]